MYSWKKSKKHTLRMHSLAVGHRAPATDLLVLIFLALMFSGCGGSSNTASQQRDAQVGGNWQFALSTTNTSLSVSPLQGGFLLQKNGVVTGQLVFSVVVSINQQPVTCNSGTAPITGTISGQTVNLTAAIGALDATGAPTIQTLTLSGGTLSSDGTAIQNGSYTLSAASALVQNQLIACGGGSQDSGTWGATLVPPVTGGVQGFFHSTNGSTFVNQDVSVSGTFTQGPNIGAASATVTGTLFFQDPLTLLNDYPCLTTASVIGTISGNTVLLQIFSAGGTPVGQIGQTPGSGNPPTAVTFDSTQNEYVLHNLQGAGPNQSGGGYVVTTKSCPTSDSGNLCLALGSSKACNQPITLTPFSLIFPPQLVGSVATSQTFTLNNTSGSTLSGLTLGFRENDSLLFYNSGGDFNGVQHFTEQDNCSQQGSISLDPGASCSITVSFSPQESCPWLPQPQGGPAIDGLAPAQCPITLTASLTITVPKGSADADTEFSAAISGSGLSAVVPSVPEIDFGAQALGESSPAQTLSFTNQSSHPVTILPAMPCVYSATFA